RYVQEVAHDVVPGESPHRPGVLAGHDRRVRGVHHGASHVTSREHVGYLLDTQEVIDWNSAEAVWLDGEQPGEWVGPHARAPDHRGRRNFLARLEGDPRRADRDDVDP